MEAFKVVSGVLQVAPGAVIGLTASQAGSRGHALDVVENRANVYRAKTALQFVTGEIVGLEEIESSIGLSQLPKIEKAGDEDLRALQEKEQAAAAAARKAKAHAKETAKGIAAQKNAVSAARIEGRKAGYAEGFKAGEARGHERGFAEGQAAAEKAEADRRAAEGAVAERQAAEESEWAKAYEADPALRATHPTLDAYIQARRESAKA